MADPFNPNVFTSVGVTVENATTAFLMPAIGNLVGAIQILAVTGVSIYLLLMGYAIITGSVRHPLAEFIKIGVKLLIIVFLGLTVGSYNSHVVEVFEALSTGLVTAMTGGDLSGTIYTNLDLLLGKAFEIVTECFDQASAAGVGNIGHALAWITSGIVVGIGSALITLAGGSTIIVAKFALAIMFAVGPLFLLALMFPITARFFDSWFSQVMNYILRIMIVAVVLTFAITAFNHFISAADFSGDGVENPIFASIQIGVISAIMMLLIRESAGMASGLAGGLAMGALTVRSLLSPVSATGRAINSPSTRRDMQSGMMVTAGRTNHLLSGNSIVNPAYLQHVARNTFRNWGRMKGGEIKQ